MTEFEWLTSADPQAVLGAWWWKSPAAGDRKLRLFACACCRQVWDGVECVACHGLGVVGKQGIQNLPVCYCCEGNGRIGGLTDPRSRAAVEVAERVADGQADDITDMLPAVHQAYAAWSAGRDDLCFLPWAACGDFILDSLGTNWWAVTRRFGLGPAQADLLRCICGNPFRPVTWGRHMPEWVTDGAAWGTAVAVARGVYESRDFSDMPILADALLDAGCPPEVECPGCNGRGGNEPDAMNTWDCGMCKKTGRILNPVLAHCREKCCAAHRGEFHLKGCRGGKTHARGCWVVDLVLGKG